MKEELVGRGQVVPGLRADGGKEGVSTGCIVGAGKGGPLEKCQQRNRRGVEKVFLYISGGRK